jgi:hypothetical protein
VKGARREIAGRKARNRLGEGKFGQGGKDCGKVGEEGQGEAREQNER